MPFSTAASNYQLDQWGTNKALYMSAHSAYSAQRRERALRRLLRPRGGHLGRGLG